MVYITHTLGFVHCQLFIFMPITLFGCLLLILFKINNLHCMVVCLLSKMSKIETKQKDQTVYFSFLWQVRVSSSFPAILLSAYDSLVYGCLIYGAQSLHSVMSRPVMYLDIPICPFSFSASSGESGFQVGAVVCSLAWMSCGIF